MILIDERYAMEASDAAGGCIALGLIGYACAWVGQEPPEAWKKAEAKRERRRTRNLRHAA